MSTTRGNHNRKIANARCKSRCRRPWYTYVCVRMGAHCPGIIHSSDDTDDKEGRHAHIKERDVSTAQGNRNCKTASALQTPMPGKARKSEACSQKTETKKP